MFQSDNALIYIYKDTALPSGADLLAVYGAATLSFGLV